MRLMQVRTLRISFTAGLRLRGVLPGGVVCSGFGEIATGRGDVDSGRNVVDGGVRGDDIGGVCGAAVSEGNGWRGGASTVAGRCAFMSPSAYAGSQ